MGVMTMQQANISLESLMKKINENNKVRSVNSAHCSKHGEFKQTVFVSGKKSICPQCLQSIRAAEQQRQAAIRSLQITEIIGKCGIPPRHQACRVSNYQTNSQKQNELKLSVKRYIEDLLAGSLKRNFVMLGNCGTGKTHLASAVGMAAISAGKTVLFCTASEVIRRVQATHKSQHESEFDLMNQYSKLDLLILDEVGVQYQTESANRIITEIVNDRYNNELPTMFLSNLSVAEFSQTMGERAMSRMKEDGCVPFICDWEDYRQLAA